MLECSYKTQGKEKKKKKKAVLYQILKLSFFFCKLWYQSEKLKMICLTFSFDYFSNFERIRISKIFALQWNMIYKKNI
jgi:hypothetical protein